jgi:dTDP-4-dehydrorhamnose 3,5-epimerase
MGEGLINNDHFIEGVSYSPLKKIKDERGMVMHHINHLSPTYKGFEESYISKTYPGKLKAWKLHLKMTQNFCVPSGKLHFVLFDDRENSSTKGMLNEFVLDEDENYYLLCIPPGIWYGFECLSAETALIVNLSNVLYDPAEALKLEPFDNTIPYSGWVNYKDK